DEDAVVAAVVVSAQEQADGIAGEDHGQGESHTPEGAFDDTADAIAHGPANVPPFEGGDDDRESDEEEGSAVSLRRCLIGRLVAESLTCTVSGHVGHSPPCTGDNVCPGFLGPRSTGPTSVLARCAFPGTRSGGSRSGRHVSHRRTILRSCPANPQDSACHSRPAEA